MGVLKFGVCWNILCNVYRRSYQGCVHAHMVKRVSQQDPQGMHPICRKRQEKAALEEAKEMAGQLETNIEEGDIYQLPGEEDEEEGAALDLPSVLRRIREVARVLDNFKVLRDAKRSRSEYLDQVSLKT